MTTFTKKQAQEIIDAADAVITALAGTNDDVHPDNHQKMCQLYDELNDRYATPEIVRELARIALQSLDAKPIAWTDNDELDDARKGYSAYLFALDGEANKFADPRRKVMLYTAPPVQPVIPEQRQMVPDERPADSSNGNDAEAWFDEGWNACRAEMLKAQPVSEPYKLKDAVADIRNSGVEIDAHKIKAERDALNSPVITEGWKLVPEEATMDMLKAGAKQDMKGEAFQYVWSAMLAAAPTAQESE